MAQWLKGLPTAAENQVEFPILTMAAENLNSSSRSGTLTWPLQAMHTHGKHTQTQAQHACIQNKKQGCWRNSSVVRSACFSSKGPMFNSQYPHGVAHKHYMSKVTGSVTFSCLPQAPNT